LFEIDKFSPLDIISESYKLEQIREIGGEFHFYDTFGFRLFFNELCLYRKDNIIYLQGKGLKELLSCTLSDSDLNLHFWWDINDEAIRGYLKNIVGVRALNEIFKMDIVAREYNIYNDNSKIIASISAFDFPQFYFTLLRINRLKGYKKEAKNTKLILENAGAYKLKSVLKFIFEKAGITTNEYTTKICANINKSDLTCDATKVILKEMLILMEKNISGIKSHIDAEFLHDFRVALRRTRTALTQLKGIFKEEYILTYKKNFSEITNRTNRARDLDIQYLTFVELKFNILDNLKPGLTILLNYLNELRNKEYNKLAKFLTTKIFNSILNKWGKFIESTDINNFGENGLKPVGQMAPYYIIEALKKVNKKYQSVIKNFNPRNMHKMRISCKKLRYVLEFFSPIYNEPIYEKTIEALKTLQDTLGLYQDVEVQKKMLSEIMNGLSKNEDFIKDIFMTTGYFFRLLEEKQQKSTTNFLEYFDNFIDLIDSKKFRKVLNF
jgi:CHAD domain-containing protein